ncbi:MULTISPECIES: acyl-CoA dehydrogenase family protein [Neobacillus]|uniref:Acyl-CoA/acyl-ACP dehydrogenase n=1 Tax=Neobacillus rhizophilus TaxID=2833579 RepID=A0A942U9H8_9BACI|nr:MULTISPECIES: acyl-CoA dehydrogenase family protein [Neobacillus]MBS4215087.1 acyl-CoA/acyl-ACP dehydrogenase [Neobacillus rhizophilus]
MITNKEEVVLKQIIDEYLQPFIRQIDEHAYYPKEFLSSVGKAGFFHPNGLQKEHVNNREMYLIEETAKYCMTSAFTLWCHLAGLASVRLSNNFFINKNLLPLLESGDKLVGTGLSNALKFYAGLETIRLKAERVDGGYIINGSLPSVSNLKDDHWFVILASLNHHQRIMCMIPVKIEGLALESKTNFVGINGSATYSCSLHNVYVPDDWIIAEEADSFIQKVRPTLALYQIPLGIGVSYASLKSMEECYSRDVEVNQHLKPQPKELIEELQCIREKAYKLANTLDLSLIWKEILLTRLEIAKLTLKVVHADMLYSGGQAYLQGSAPFRRLREAYFLVNLSPTIKHLEMIKLGG